MRSERFFKNSLLPFAEVRYSKASSTSFKPHMHHTLSIGAVDQGEVIFNISNRKLVLLPGSLAIINSETLHACNPAAEIERSYYMLYLDAEWCFRVQQSMWETDSFVEMSKIMIEDTPLYMQYCKTMEHLIEPKVQLQQKSRCCSTWLVKFFQSPVVLKI